MARVLERVRAQIELVEEQTGNMDPRTNFRLIVVQTELERVKFVVRSYLRVRLAKVRICPFFLFCWDHPGVVFSFHLFFGGCFVFDSFYPNLSSMNQRVDLLGFQLPALLFS